MLTVLIFFEGNNVLWDEGKEIGFCILVERKKERLRKCEPSLLQLSSLRPATVLHTKNTENTDNTRNKETAIFLQQDKFKLGMFPLDNAPH